MISVAEAVAAIRGVTDLAPVETVALAEAEGRTLATDLVARLDNPPFDAAAMDGYALPLLPEVALDNQTFMMAGEAAAGRALPRALANGEAARIFTGAPLPTGALRVAVQESAQRIGDSVTFRGAAAETHIRRAGADFRIGHRLLEAGQQLTPADIALAASGGYGALPVRRRPRIAFLPTGDELVAPGVMPGDCGIVSSLPVGLIPFVRRFGGRATALPIARDVHGAVARAVAIAAADADLIVTIGGASVGDHDLVWQELSSLGAQTVFRTVNLRPGKPTAFATLGARRVLCLPGNPTSAFVSARLFLTTFLAAALGGADPLQQFSARTGVDLPRNGPRETYMRARLEHGLIMPAPLQDSGFVAPMTTSRLLLIRPPDAQHATAGTNVHYMDMFSSPM